MTFDQDIPARVHIVLRQECGKAIIIRRGPSNHVCSIGWDLETDELQLGQWLKGRIYERRCDLSPDGRHWIYFAMNGRWHEPSQGSWTAVARWPWLKAVQFFPKGDCWGGGGLFTGPRQLWLNALDTSQQNRPKHTQDHGISADGHPPRGAPRVGHGGGDEVLNCDWIDHRRGRVYWVRDGRLYEGELQATGLCGELLLDFNGMSFEPTEAPY